jgi:5-formyltetrahydrofolate cyclo-ligase
VYVPTPRLRAGFRRLDPKKIPGDRYREASTLAGASRWGEAVALAELPAVDLIVTGSVAVTREGRRCGKGHGYGDLEYAILRELGHPPVPVLTTAHPLQVVRDFPAEPHDLPVSVIATPEQLIEVARPPPAPTGIAWAELSEQAFQEMPVLRELRALKSRG